MAILSKPCKPDNFESHNSLKLSFTNIWGLSFEFCWFQIFPWVKVYWHSGSVWDKLGWLNWFWQFLCVRLSSFNAKWFLYSYAWFHSLCETRTSLCMGPISREFCRFLCFQLALLHSVSYFFFLYQSPSSSLYTVFDSISSSIDKVLSINPTANVFVFANFSIHHKDWLTYYGGTDQLGEFCYNFSMPNDLTQMFNFPTRIPDCDSHSPPLFDLFLSSDASICSTMAFPLLRNSIKFAMGCPISLHNLWLFSYWLGWSLWSFQRYSMGGYLKTCCFCCC